ncbi:MerR family transcriptional regulator [Chlorobium phaeobacteroides]|jgi:DNA-binding transcriptional MerR regulator|uniref:Transcriptional regulator, MerR family n=1 Tax=Chlorobium phaeobacteroides (strain DSM 266 / SMG 266 / 2430) TaxID=290317 RepID=A1BHM8_CHLPD|nr:MerR family transcriptional regulator [Chlorobium phaeobacteroides]ABL65905.1 transcriptional regulator, MerR family [Chlorobium phaeobacteroides DSM 266]MBV5319979.1 MerR family transcriptional regulator [Chlorobium phaeobacteroides]
MAFDTSRSYYTIGEVSKIVGIPAYLLRYWENFFTELNPARDTRSNRRYTNRDIAMVLNIKELVYEKGYKLGKASEMVKGGMGRTPEGDHKTSEILKLQKLIGHEQKKHTIVDERRMMLLREIKEEIEDLLQLIG